MKPVLRWGLAAGVTGGGLYLAFRGIDADGIRRSLQDLTSPGRLTAIPVIMGLEYLLRTLRWGAILRERPGALRRLYPTVAAAFFLNNVLPFRAGEAARVYATHRRTAKPLAACVAALAVDRLCDVLSILMVLAGALVFRAEGTASLARGVGVLAVGGAGALMVLGLARWPDRARALLSPSWAPPFFHRLRDEFLMGLAPLGRGRSWIPILLLSAGIWGLNVFLFQAVAPVFGFSLTLAQSGGVLVAVALGVALPSTPGYVGTYEAAGVGALTLFGIEKTPALSFVLVFHAIQIVGSALWGAPALWFLSRPARGLQE